MRSKKGRSDRKLHSVVVSLLLVCAFLFIPISHTLERQEVEAGGAFTGTCPWTSCEISQLLNTVKNTLSWVANKATAFFTGSDWFRENILDSLGWFLINRAIEIMAADIITWINNGFEGNPAFVTDLRGHLLQLADETAGAFIYGSKLGFLCSPFELDVRAALALQYADGRDVKVQCTLSETVSNMEQFMGGDFLAGGWNGWFQMTQRASNNPYGALVLAQDELSVRLRNAKGEEKTLLDYGRGFFSYESCKEVEGGEIEPGTGNVQESCELTTPGAAIQDQLEQALNLPRDRLLVADEFNEVLAALFNQLVTQMFQVGVSGLSDNETYDEPYTFQLREHAEEATQGDVNSEDYVGIPEETPEYEPIEYQNEDELYNELKDKRDEIADESDKKENGGRLVCEGSLKEGMVCHVETEGETEMNQGNADASDIPTGEVEGDSINDSGLPGDPIEDGAFGEPQPNPTPGLPNPGESF